MKAIYCVLFALSLFGAVKPTQSSQPTYKTTVYYCPMHLQTYEAVTSTDIEKMYDMTSLVQPDVDKIIAILHKGTPSTIPNEDFRLKLVCGGQTILLSMGRTAIEGKKITRITREQYEQIYKLICDDVPSV